MASDRIRSPAELRTLVDVVRISAGIGFLVDLGLPWWTQTDHTFERAGDYTGWASLGAGHGATGLAWITVVAMIGALGIAPFRRGWLTWAGAAVGTLGVLAMLLGLANLSRLYHYGHTHDGLWIGSLLLVIVVAMDLADLRLAALARTS